MWAIDIVRFLAMESVAVGPAILPAVGRLVLHGRAWRKGGGEHAFEIHRLTLTRGKPYAEDLEIPQNLTKLII